MDFQNRWFLCKTCGQYIRTPERFLGHKKKECKLLKLNSRTCSTPIVRYHEKSDHTSEHHQRRSSGIEKTNNKCYAANRPVCLKEHMRMRIHSTEASFVCKLCNFAAKNPETLKRHSRCHIGETPFKCDECPASFNTRKFLGYHIARQHPVEEHQLQMSKVDCIVDLETGAKTYKCKFCKYAIRHAANMKSHIRTHTGERPFVCKVCNYACKQRSSLTVHMRSHAGETPFKCNQCPASFNKQLRLAAHFAKQHEERGPGEIEAYLRKFAKGETKVCRFCPKLFQSVHSRKIHERIHTGEEPFECKICSTRFKHKSTFKRHKLIHDEEAKPFKCAFCDYACRDRRSLDTHVRNHTGEKPYECNLCDAAFKQATHLKQHLYVHNNVKNCKCNLCPYSTRTMSSLKSHLRSHTNEKPYACDVCDYTCRRLGGLKVHKRKHAGEKPFKCDLCDYAAITSGSIKRHRLTIHTKIEEKLFKCTICQYATGLSSALKSHMRVHSSVKPYECNQCSFTTKYQGNLSSHMKTHNCK